MRTCARQENADVPACTFLGSTKYWLIATMQAQLRSAATGSVGLRMGFSLRQHACRAAISYSSCCLMDVPNGMRVDKS